MIMHTRYYSSPDFSCSNTLDPHPDPSKFRLHTHVLGELFCFKQGRAIFHIEGSQYPMEPGDIVLMRPTEAHYIAVSPDFPYERTVINFDMALFDRIEPEHRLLQAYYSREAGKQNVYHAKAFGDNSYMDHIHALAQHTGSRLASLADLILLLTKINTVFVSQPACSTEEDTVDQRILRYINNNLASPLALEHLCDRFFISRAQLSRRFRKATGTSVAKYITAKRLIHAQQLIRSGSKPTEVFSVCGFQDYSTFYRAYSKYFGYSPKDALLERSVADPEEGKILIW